MLSAELSRTALGLPPEERLELARRLVESVVEPAPLTDAVKEGIRRIEAVATGHISGSPKTNIAPRCDEGAFSPGVSE